jgi:hypothetical protein
MLGMYPIRLQVRSRVSSTVSIRELSPDEMRRTWRTFTGHAVAVSTMKSARSSKSRVAATSAMVGSAMGAPVVRRQAQAGRFHATHDVSDLRAHGARGTRAVDHHQPPNVGARGDASQLLAEHPAVGQRRHRGPQQIGHRRTRASADTSAARRSSDVWPSARTAAGRDLALRRPSRNQINGTGTLALHLRNCSAFRTNTAAAQTVD